MPRRNRRRGRALSAYAAHAWTVRNSHLLVVLNDAQRPFLAVRPVLLAIIGRASNVEDPAHLLPLKLSPLSSRYGNLKMDILRQRSQYERTGRTAHSRGRPRRDSS